MLKLKNVKKNYFVGEQIIAALNGVSLNFRKSEFVAILGQSGCGKTTLMNIIGGLDKMTEGEMLLDGASTASFTETEWDDYRNAKIGFVFQSYNLIQHLSVLDNVELALTISGITGDQRIQRAKEALERVGLKNEIYKKPNQLSGGQMQRVAIARALVNEPEILLADEPTGAIDSETSVQIMDLLKSVAQDKLVIMVTHNGELAEEYATRIIKILDGKIISDTNEFVEENEETIALGELPAKTRKKKRATMSFATSIKLSWKNLINKRGRSILTSIAGSIGVICIALILALNNGFSIYINDFEKQSMSKFPIAVSSGESEIMKLFEDFMGGDQLNGDSMDISSILSVFTDDTLDREKFTDEQIIYIYAQFASMFEAMTNTITKENDISKFKEHLERNFDTSLGIIKYDYSIDLNIYRTNESGTYRQLNPLPENIIITTLLSMFDKSKPGEGKDFDINSVLSMFAFWDELIGDDTVINQQYDVLAGHLPENMNEILLVVDEYNQITDFNMLLLDELSISSVMLALNNPSVLDKYDQAFDEALKKEYYILPTGAAYAYNQDTGLYENLKAKGGVALKNALDNNGIKVKISGIVRPKEGVKGCIKGVIGYTSELANFIIDDANNCAYISAQKAEYEKYMEKIIAAMPVTEKIAAGTKVSELTVPEQMLLAAAASAKIKDVITGETMTEDAYSELLAKVNVRNLDKPSYIYIYPSTVKNKQKIVSFIKEYNDAQTAEETEADQIAKENGEEPVKVTYVVEYTDDLNAAVNELKSLSNTITYILIAVALVSVLVTMLLIAIVMYISVQDRTKEIGILRAIGARKMDISNIFNVETLILGFVSGVVGILLALVLQFPVNIILKTTMGIAGLLSMSWWHPIVIICGAMAITVLAGLIPSMYAAKKDPVIALRSE